VVPSPLTIFGSGDHKAIGTVYVVAALLFGIAGWIISALASAHAISGLEFLSTNAFQTLFTLSRVGLILLVAVPFFLGLATFIVPLQVGARTVAFPRAAAAALWAWLLSSGVLIVANCIDGGIDGGRPKAVALGLLAIAGLVISLVLGTICVLTTAVTMRTPGMRLDRVPMTTWAFLVGGSIWVLTLPALFAEIMLVWVDHRYGAGDTFAADGAQWQAVSWISNQPQVYAFFIPAFGVIADAVATFTGTRLLKRTLLQTTIGAFGVLSLGVFAQTALAPDYDGQPLWIAMSVLIVIPVLLVFALIAPAFKAGKPALQSPLGLSVASLLMVLLAVVGGALLVITPLRLRDSGDLAIGHFNLVIAAALTAAAAGVMYWGPKMIGRRLADGAGKLAVPLFLGGGLLSGLAFFVLGFGNRFTALQDYSDLLLWVSILGDALISLGLFVVLAGLLSGTRQGAPEAGNDPWGTGQTLEWACASPPPTGNFGDLAIVRSPEPLLDEEA